MRVSPGCSVSCFLKLQSQRHSAFLHEPPENKFQMFRVHTAHNTIDGPHNDTQPGMCVLPGPSGPCSGLRSQQDSVRCRLECESGNKRPNLTEDNSKKQSDITCLIRTMLRFFSSKPQRTKKRLPHNSLSSCFAHTCSANHSIIRL